MKSQKTKRREERFRSSLLINRTEPKDGEKLPFYSLHNAREAVSSKISFGGGIGDDAVFSKSKLEGTLQKRFKIREAVGKFAPNGYDYSELNNDKFLETEKTIALSIRQPKKNASAKQRKIEIAHEKNERDAVSFERCEMNKLWETYCKQKKQIAFRLFESKMKQSKFKADALALR